MKKRKMLLITPDQLQNVGINNSQELLTSFKTHFEKCILLLTRNKKIPLEEKNIEFEDLNTFIDVIDILQENI